jgi:hypothetical protein
MKILQLICPLPPEGGLGTEEENFVGFERGIKYLNSCIAPLQGGWGAPQSG